MRLWQLPPRLDDLRPPDAWRFERLRRRLLDYLVAQEYQYIRPPIVEYTAALKATNPSTSLYQIGSDGGRSVSMRGDMTAQAARMDASIKQESVMRYCYAGEVLTAEADKRRNPYQIGAEIFGDAAVAADQDVVCAALQCVAIAGLTELTLDISDTSVVRSLVGGYPDALAIISRRSQPDLRSFCDQHNCQELEEVLHLSGNDLAKLQSRIRTIAPSAVTALEEVRCLSDQLLARFPVVSLHYDFAEMSSYYLHTGISWRLYTGAVLVACGGRYDGIGERFDHSRPATGFSLNFSAMFQEITPT